MWPLGEGNPRLAVQGFLLGQLGFDPSFVNNMGQIAVVRVERRRPGNITKEAVVTFESKEVRDTVRAAAHKLANSQTPAGIRLEVPDYLQTNFRALENIAFRLKKKHKNLRRNIKLDDHRLDVIMDVKVDDGSEWCLSLIHI